MAVPTGEEVAATLLRALPPDAAEAVLGRIGGPAADALRARVQAAGPPTPEELDAALTAFFDVERIADRAPPPEPPPTGEYRPVARPPAADEPPADPLAAVRELPADRLARALDGEPAPAVALVLGGLDPAAAGAVMKLLPEAVRAEVGLRLIQRGPRNPALLEQLARAVAEKGRTLPSVPPEPTEDERITRLADMLRAVPRADRIPVLQRIEAADQEMAAKVREKLYRLEDLLKVQDRQLQGLLAELDVKTIATALKSAGEDVKAKITANLSARSREVLAEEMELLGTVPAVRVKEKQGEILALLRKHEEEGKIVIEE
jgi:flagellar motor switch protein FliG